MPGVCDEIIDDIEDLISSQDITPKERYASRKTVSVRSRKRDNKIDSEPAEKVILESVVPGNLKICLFIQFISYNSHTRDKLKHKYSTLSTYLPFTN